MEQAEVRVATSWGSDPCGLLGRSSFAGDASSGLGPMGTGHSEPGGAGCGRPPPSQAPADLHSWATVRTTAVGTGFRRRQSSRYTFQLQADEGAWAEHVGGHHLPSVMPAEPRAEPAACQALGRLHGVARSLPQQADVDN
uniref:Uncharacterized protein n=1 Tax=Molossus molossus TaxID=27622 RepID=A0A7J8I0R8_MOLMO|nr:hypothetical protein HJG59_010766 [Molossus molossus]